MFRRTKILATCGPSTDGAQVLDELIQAGVNSFRINCSHGNANERVRRVEEIRQAANRNKAAIGILFDLQGPKIRIGQFEKDAINLSEGDAFIIDVSLPINKGTKKSVGTTYKNLPNDVSVTNDLMLDDGRIILNIQKIVDDRIHCKVVQGGVLSNNKGLNLKGGGLSANALTDKDLKDIKQAAELKANYLAISFPRDATDIHTARKLLHDMGAPDTRIVAKIERAEAIEKETLDEIIHASDLIMIARGDLGVEIGDECLPAVQKRIISRVRTLNRGVITATQMMESMINSPLPTRAEVFDVANAVFDGTDAVMLSAETAVGNYPVQAIKAMDRTCLNAEKQRTTTHSAHRLNQVFEKTEEALALGSMYLANHMSNLGGIAALTESGATAIYMSRISSGKPIFALTTNEWTFHQMSLYRGVFPILLNETEIPTFDKPREHIINALKKRNLVRFKQRMIVTSGPRIGMPGGSNTMEIVEV